MERYYSLSAVLLTENPRGLLSVEWDLFELSTEEETFKWSWYTMKTAYIKEVGWKMERMSLSELHGLLIAYKTFMHVGVFFI